MTDLRSEHTGGVAPGDTNDDEFERRPGHAPRHAHHPHTPGRLRWPQGRARTAALVAAVAAVIGAGTVLVTELRTPASSSPTTHGPIPGGRAGAAMAYDSSARLTVMYGGANAHGDSLYDTWTWDGASWHPLPGQPAPRLDSPTMTDDPADHGVMLVGTDLVSAGIHCGPAEVVTCPAETPISDEGVIETWILTGGAWRQMTVTGTHPTGSVSLATVPGATEVVAVGDDTNRDCHAAPCPLTPDDCLTQPTGNSCLGSIRALSWYWTNEHWTAVPQVLDLTGGLLLVPSTSAATLDVESLFSPTAASCDSGGVCPATPPVARSYHWANHLWVADGSATVEPPDGGGTVAFNGVDAAFIARDGSTWQLNGGSWSEVEPSALSAADLTDVAFAVDRNGRYVLFGGAGPDGGAGNDTWLLSPAGWSRVSGSDPTPGATTMRFTPPRCATHTSAPSARC